MGDYICFTWFLRNKSILADTHFFVICQEDYLIIIYKLLNYLCTDESVYFFTVFQEPKLPQLLSLSFPFPHPLKMDVYPPHSTLFIIHQALGFPLFAWLNASSAPHCSGWEKPFPLIFRLDLFLGSLHLLSCFLGLSFNLSSSFLHPVVYPQGDVCNFTPFRLHFARLNRRIRHLFYFFFFLHEIEYPIDSGYIFSAPFPVDFPLSLTCMTWIVPSTPGEGSAVTDGDTPAGHICLFHGWIWQASQFRSDSHLSNTIEKKSPFFILRCMRSFCATEYNPFFIILTSFKGMWLFLCVFSNSLCIHAALQLCITSIPHDFTPTFCARLSHRNILLRALSREVLEESPLFPFHTTSSSCSFPTLLHRYLPTVSALLGYFYHGIKPETQKEEEMFASFLTSAASILKWSKATSHPW